MNVQEILTLIGSMLPLLIAFLTFLVKFIKNEKAKKILNCTLELSKAIQPLIVEAEKFTHFSGEEKKQYVLTKANQFARGKIKTFNPNEIGRRDFESGLFRV